MTGLSGLRGTTGLSAVMNGFLPYGIDFSIQSDGNMPIALRGTTWAIVSGEAINTPTLGSELLTDPGLEANYTGGLCDTLTKTGGPTVSQSADVHGGSKAQQFIATAQNDRLNWPGVAGTVGQWYQYSVWVKRTGTDTGIIRLAQVSMLPTVMRLPIDVGSYTQKVVSMIATVTNNILVYPMYELGNASFPTILADDGSLKAITASSLFALLPETQPDVVAKIKVSFDTNDGSLFGIVVRADTRSNPTNCIFAYIRLHPTNLALAYVGIIKKIGSTYTQVLSDQSVTIDTAAWLEVRLSGSTVQLFYDETQEGGDQTINDAELVNNEHHGLFSSSSNLAITNFFCARHLIDYALVFAGSSITIYGFSWAYPNQARADLIANYPQFDVAFQNSATGAWATWSNLVNLQANMLDYTPQLVIFDTVNDDGSDLSNASVEALIRRIWGDYPECKILVFNFPKLTDKDVNASINSPTNQAGITTTEALATHYGIPLLDYLGTIQDLVNNQGHNLNEYYVDNVHPDEDGHNEAFALLQPYLISGGGSKPATLPARLYDNGDYENTPTILDGTDFDSRTGAWVDVGTTTSSNQVGATITYSATCQSFGCLRDNLAENDVTVDIDGGGFVAMAFGKTGTEIPAGRGAHTITIKVASGTVKIDEFWAI